MKLQTKLLDINITGQYVDDGAVGCSARITTKLGRHQFRVFLKAVSGVIEVVSNQVADIPVRFLHEELNSSGIRFQILKAIKSLSGEEGFQLAIVSPNESPTWKPNGLVLDSNALAMMKAEQFARELASRPGDKDRNISVVDVCGSVLMSISPRIYA